MRGFLVIAFPPAKTSVTEGGMIPMSPRVSCIATLSLVLAALLGLLGGLVAAQAEPILQEGDRMVFLGDSITQQRIYTRYVMNFFALRYPDMYVTFRNAGIGGDTAVGGIKRLDEDVLEAHPEVVSICFGMNDAGYTEFEQDRYEEFLAAMTVLVTELQKSDIQVLLLTPGPVDPDRSQAWFDSDPYNGVLARYAEGVEDLAARKEVPVFNIHELLYSTQTLAKAADPEFTMIPDAIHPSPPGQALMAYALLYLLGCEQRPSGLEIDARAGTFEPDQCLVEEFEVTDSEITFLRRDEALPTYFDPEVADVVEHAPMLPALNHYPFRAAHLPEGEWVLTADGMEVGVFTAEELGDGLDLADHPGPWRVLGETVNELAIQQEDYYLQKRRLAGMFSWLSAPPPEAEMEKLALMEKLEHVVEIREHEVRELVDHRTWEWRLERLP
jgi:lysophospholipase L1-like esterase